jgi:hypothetical protein
MRRRYKSELYTESRSKNKTADARLLHWCGCDSRLPRRNT